MLFRIDHLGIHVLDTQHHIIPVFERIEDSADLAVSPIVTLIVGIKYKDLMLALLFRCLLVTGRGKTQFVFTGNKAADKRAVCEVWDTTSVSTNVSFREINNLGSPLNIQR